VGSRDGLKSSDAIELALEGTVVFEGFTVDDFDGAIGAHDGFGQPHFPISAVTNTAQQIVIGNLWRLTADRVCVGNHHGSIFWPFVRQHRGFLVLSLSTPAMNLGNREFGASRGAREEPQGTNSNGKRKKRPSFQFAFEFLAGCYFPHWAYLLGRETGFRSFAAQAV